MKKIKVILGLLIFSVLTMSAQPALEVIEGADGREGKNILFKETTRTNLRLEATHTIPFSDNFNYNTDSDFLNNWENFGTDIVRVINGPSSRAVRFNGLRSNRTRYNADSNIRVKTDTLISKPIDASVITGSGNVVFRFMWQGGGSAPEQPSPSSGDSLLIYFKNSKGDWIPVWKAPENYNKSLFNTETILFTDTGFHHSNFQFRFESYGRSRENTSPWFVTNIELSVTGTIPFWNDFSDPAKVLMHFKPNTGVYINNHLARNAPSVNVATFDGLDDYGKTYFTTTEVQMGEGDSLVSWPLNLNPVTSGIRREDSLRFYFLYEKAGYGESPDRNEGDSLMLMFYDKNNRWRQVWTSSFTEAADTSRFHPVMLTVSDTAFFHSNFKFKFFNYTRLSGSFDLWHVDYITLDTIKRGTNLVRQIAGDSLGFSDVAASGYPSSFFRDYTSVPAHHLRAFNPGLADSIRFQVSNLSIGRSQASAITTIYLNDNEQDTVLVPANLYKVGVTDVIYPLKTEKFRNALTEFLNGSATDTTFTVRVKTEVKSNTISNPVYTFFTNDTISNVYEFGNYYAYDDGNYEYGEYLEQDKGMQAMAFDLLAPDTLTAIDFCTPYLGYNPNGTRFFLKVWLADAKGHPGREIYSHYEAARLSNGRNPFSRFEIKKKTLPVSGRIFIGYQQVKGFSQALRIGYDVNNDNKDKLFYDNNRGNGWSQERNISGTLMIRPVFANKALNIEAQKRVESITMFPNPNNTDMLNFSSDFEWVEVLDFGGNRKRLEYNVNKVNLSGLAPGLYFVKGYKEGVIIDEKLIIEQR